MCYAQKVCAGLFAAASLLILPAVSSAGQVCATLDSLSPYYSFNYSNSTNGTSGYGVPAAEQNWHKTSGGAGIPQNFHTFCVQLTQYVGFGGNYCYDIVPLENVPNLDNLVGPMGSNKADNIRELFGRHYSELDTATEFSAFQISIWEIVNEKTLPYDLGTGNFQGSSNASVISMANTWLSELDGTGPKASLVGLTNGSAQDHVTIATPEPASLVLAAMGAVGFIGVGIRRRRQA